MPRRNTLDVTPRKPKLKPAAGLYCTRPSNLYLFKDYRHLKPEPITIGRGTSADIRIRDDLGVSNVHAALKWTRRRAVKICDIDSRNGIYIDDEKITEPVVLCIGMVVWLGRTRLIATNEHGAFPIWATTVSELCRKSLDLYGNCATAGRHVGRSKDFVRRQLLSREQRYTKFKPNTLAELRP